MVEHVDLVSYYQICVFWDHRINHFLQVEVAFSGIEEKGENIKSESANAPMKVLPPWMIKQGMNLTKEQRGDVKEEVKMAGSSATVGLSDEKKSATETDDVKNIQVRTIKVFMLYFLFWALFSWLILIQVPNFCSKLLTS